MVGVPPDRGNLDVVDPRILGTLHRVGEVKAVVGVAVQADLVVHGFLLVPGKSKWSIFRLP
jgi:DNA-binding cell septation regulator SpoVG